MIATIFDVETTYGEHLGRKGSSFASGIIDLCASGFLHDSGEYESTYHVKEEESGARRGSCRGSRRWLDSFPDLTGVDILVGHNIKFDLLWYWKHPRLEAFLMRGGRIWDTAYTEYLLSGQFYNLKQLPHLLPSLKNIASRRGLTLKLDVVAALWEQGIRTEDINEDLLMEYLHGDCKTTQELFEQQYAQAKRQNQLHMIEGRMEGLLATTEMEFNGLKIDLIEAETRQLELGQEIEELSKKLNTYLPNLPEELEFNWGSSAHLSALLFGGEIKYQARAEVTDEAGNPVYYKHTVKRPVLDDDGNCVYYKSGKNAGAVKYKNHVEFDIERGPKTRLEDFYFELPRQTEPKAKWKTATPGRYSTNAEVLTELGDRDIELVKTLLALRGKEKDLGTYYKRFYRGRWTGMLTMVDDEGFIHHSLNHFVTATSRLSSSKPNLQNLSGKGKSKVRLMFVSRFGKDGLMAEGDYSQLEVVCKGVLSGDENLLQALVSGVDFHCDWLALSPLGEGLSYEEVFRLCKVVKDEHWKAKRKQIKSLTFGEQFGAGVPSLAESTGMTAEQVTAAIEARKAKYPKVYEYDDTNIAAVKKSRRLSTLRTPNGMQAGIGYLRTATDTIFHFIENDAPDWLQHQGIMTSFTPTTIKNYPSQGLGGEIMQVSLGRLFRWLLKNNRFDDKVLMVNTVHDCVWFDLHSDYRHVLSEAKEIMEDVCPHFNKHYPNVQWNTPFPVEFEIGPDAYNLEPMDFNGGQHDSE